MSHAVPSGGVPYPICSSSVLVLWRYLANSLSQRSNSLVEQERAITRIFLSRLVVPFPRAIAGPVDFPMAFAALLRMMLARGMSLRATATE